MIGRCDPVAVMTMSAAPSAVGHPFPRHGAPADLRGERLGVGVPCGW